MDLSQLKYDDEFVLVVDDEEYVSEPIVQMLQNLGFQAKSVNNGVDTLEQLKKEPVTFVITDLRMPEMNGLELLQQVQANYPQVITMAMTGYTMEFTYVDVINSGATDFIKKPFGIEELEAKIKRALIERNIKLELKRKTLRDSVTGLYNQRHFYKRLNAEIIRAVRQNHTLALIILDLDNFKQYNETNGHLEGDKLLQKVGRIINNNIRQGVDSAYRYGGDEFAIILVETDSKINQVILERIETSILRAYHSGISIGCVQYSADMNQKDFLKAAGQKLSEGKAKKVVNKK